MNFENIFKPIQIGPMNVPNRFVVPPMGNNFANTDGTLSEKSKNYYAARAKGGFGLITIESSVVYYKSKGGPRKPCLGFWERSIGEKAISKRWMKFSAWHCACAGWYQWYFLRPACSPENI